VHYTYSGVCFSLLFVWVELHHLEEAQYISFVLGCCYVEVVYDLFGLSFFLCEQEYILNMFVYILGSLFGMYTWVYLRFGLVC
jgi:hypothetical protein